MTQQYELTQQDRRILNLISFSNGTSRNRSRYSMVDDQNYPGLDQMTIEQVLDTLSGENVGAYNISTDTLNSIVESAGLNTTLRYTPAVQDYIALTLMLTYAEYTNWKTGGCFDSEDGEHTPRLTRDVWPGPSENFNHAVFLLNLSKIFPSLPVPIRLNDYTSEDGTTYPRPTNSSYYGENLATQNSRTLILELKSIYSTGAGRSINVSLMDSQAYVPSSTQQALDAAGGGQDYQKQGRPHAVNDIGSLRDIKERGMRRRDPRDIPPSSDTVQTLPSYDLDDANAELGYTLAEAQSAQELLEFNRTLGDGRVVDADLSAGERAYLEQRRAGSSAGRGTVVERPGERALAEQARREAEVGLDAFGGATTTSVTGGVNNDVYDDAILRQSRNPVGTGGGPVPTSSPVTGLLPPVDNPYSYQFIDPLDNRYDFRTGKKVIDLLINGTASAASYANDPNARRYGEPGARIPGVNSTEPRRPNPTLGSRDPRRPNDASSYNPYEPIEFNSDAYIVRNVIENPVDSNGNIAVIATPDGRVAELEIGQTLFTSPGENGEPGEVVTITGISSGGTVNLSNGETLNRVGQYADSSSVIGQKINEIAPADEEPEGENLPIRTTIENDIALFNSLVQQESSYMRVIPIDIGDGKAYYVSSDYYRDSRGDWPATALSPRSGSSSPAEYAVQVAQRLNGSLPPREIIQWIENEANVDHWLVGFTTTPNPSDDSVRTGVNNRIREEFRSRGIQPGELVAGHKKSFDADGGFWGLARPEGGIYQNGGAFSSVHSTDYYDYSHGTRIYWGGVDLETGERFGPVQLLRSGSPQIGPAEDAPPPTPLGEQPSYMNDTQWRLLNSGVSGQDPTDTVQAVEEVAAELGVHPSAIMGKLQTESGLGGVYSPERLNSGTFRGAWQVGRGVFDDNGGTLTDLDGNAYTFEEFSQLSYSEQIRVYPSYLRSYNNWNNNLANSLPNQPPNVQFAVLQGMQFAPNGSWVRDFDNGVFTTPTTPYQQSMSASTGTSINGLLEWWDRGFSN